MLPLRKSRSAKLLSQQLCGFWTSPASRSLHLRAPCPSLPQGSCSSPAAAMAAHPAIKPRLHLLPPSSLLPCRRFSSAEAAVAATLEAPIADDCHFNPADSSRPASAGSTHQEHGPRPDCTGPSVALEELGSSRVAEVCESTASPASASTEGEALPLESTGGGEGTESRPDKPAPTPLLEAVEPDILLDHNVKTPAVELHAFGAAGSSTQAIASVDLPPLPSSSGMTDREMLEEQRQWLHGIRVQLEEQKHLLNLLVEDLRSLKATAELAGNSTLVRQVQLLRRPKLPTWPQLTSFIAHLKSLGCFKGEELKVPEGVDVFKESECLKRAMVTFARAAQPHFGSLTRENLEVLGEYICPTYDRKTIASQRRLQNFILLDHARFSALPFSFQLKLVDVARIIHSLTVSPSSQLGTLPERVLKSIFQLLEAMCSFKVTSEDIDLVLKGRKAHQIKEEGVVNDEKLELGALTTHPAEVANGIGDQDGSDVKIVKEVLRNEPEAQPEVDSDEWKCPRCKFMNLPHKAKCVECSYKRPRHAHGKSIPDSDVDNQVALEEDLDLTKTQKKSSLKRHALGKPIPEADVDNQVTLEEDLDLPKTQKKASSKPCQEEGETTKSRRSTHLEREITQSDGEDSELSGGSDIDYLDDIISSEDSDEENKRREAPSKHNPLSNLVKDNAKSLSHDRRIIERSGQQRGRDKGKVKGNASVYDNSDSQGDDQQNSVRKVYASGSGNARGKSRNGYNGDRGERYSKIESFDDDNDFNDRRVRSYNGRSSREREDTGSRSGRDFRKGSQGRGRPRY